jgi:hypothetical protein
VVARSSALGLSTPQVIARTGQNPFNNSLEINYAVNAASDVSVNAFSTEGKLIATLASGPQDAGQYSVSWDASDIPSGTYFIRIEADGQHVQTLKTVKQQ